MPEFPVVEPAASGMALECRSVAKRYGSHSVLHETCLGVEQGASVWLRGPNGVGKSTLLKCIAGAETITAGDILIADHSILDKPVTAKAKVGFAADDPFLYPYLTASEHLELWASLRGLRERHVALGKSLLDLVSVGRSRERQTRTYSRGMRQQLGFVGAIFFAPALLILDEPMTATDVENTQICLDLLRSYRRAGGTVLFTTHSPSLGEELKTREHVLTFPARQPMT
jgi:ABC-2 type transport system ATP-binding protein